MRFKEFLDKEEQLEEAPKKGLEQYLGKTITAKDNIYIISRDDIEADPVGDIFTEKELKNQFLWMKKGLKTKLTALPIGRDPSFISSADGNFDLSEELIERLLNGRLITIK